MIDEGERRIAMLAMSAIGGSIVGLWYLPWKTMGWGERLFAILVGIAFSIFGVPWAVADLMGVDIAPLRVACGTTFFGAVFGIPLMPILKDWLVEKLPERLGLKKGGEA